LVRIQIDESHKTLRQRVEKKTPQEFAPVAAYRRPPGIASL
jgi:hypothetical protein